MFGFGYCVGIVFVQFDVCGDFVDWVGYVFLCLVLVVFGSVVYL